VGNDGDSRGQFGAMAGVGLGLVALRQRRKTKRQA
jgi:MYXO-CTERM domain-containing protein